MEYTEVKNAHIVPRCYLANFAIDDALMLAVDGRAPVGPISIDNAAIRRRFYRRFRPDGTPIDDIEWSLSVLEGVVAPIIKKIGARGLPLDIEGKQALAEFFAFQFVRGPRWKAWRESQTRDTTDRQRRNPEPVLRNGIWIPVTQRQINEEEDRALGGTAWLTDMMVIANRLITAFGSMRWDLVEFGEPLLVISDHPVVAWPLDADHRRPDSTPTGLGVLNFREVRVPLSPTVALLMTWQDEMFGEQVFEGSDELAANLNAFTIANADRQWMYLPGGRVPTHDGYHNPISSQLFDGFGIAEVEASDCRREVKKIVERKLGQDIHETVDKNGRMHAEIVTARSRYEEPAASSPGVAGSGDPSEDAS